MQVFFAPMLLIAECHSLITTLNKCLLNTYSVSVLINKNVRVRLLLGKGSPRARGYHAARPGSPHLGARVRGRYRPARPRRAPAAPTDTGPLGLRLPVPPQRPAAALPVAETCRAWAGPGPRTVPRQVRDEQHPPHLGSRGAAPAHGQPPLTGSGQGPARTDPLSEPAQDRPRRRRRTRGGGVRGNVMGRAPRTRARTHARPEQASSSGRCESAAHWEKGGALGVGTDGGE